MLEHLLPLAAQGLTRCAQSTRPTSSGYSACWRERVAQRPAPARSGRSIRSRRWASTGRSPSAAARSPRRRSSNQEEGPAGRAMGAGRLRGAEEFRSRTAFQHRRAGDDLRRLHTCIPRTWSTSRASLMDWERLCSVPVEDQTGHLLGLLSWRAVAAAALARQAQSAECLCADRCSHEADRRSGPRRRTLEALQTDAQAR